MRAMMNGNNVAFFQAGDMTEKQQLRRMAVYLAKRSDRERYCGERQIPCVDCWYNQTDDCELSEGNNMVFVCLIQIWNKRRLPLTC